MNADGLAINTEGLSINAEGLSINAEGLSINTDGSLIKEKTSMDSLRLQTRLTLFACLLACVVVAMGAFTRLVDAGLGCPDWPGCYGHLMWPETSTEISAAEILHPDAPVDTDKTWPEMVHRYFAGSLGLVILSLALLGWRQRNQRDDQIQTDSEPFKHLWLLLGLVVVQALFGMWTVTLKLWPQVVTAHLLGGFATLSLLWLLFLRLRAVLQQRKLPTGRSGNLSPRQYPARLRGLALTGLLAVVLQASLGGWTSSNYAALACIDFPTCHGEWLPVTDFTQGFNITQRVGPNYLGGLMSNEARTAIHLSHRVGALVVTVLLMLLMSVLWRVDRRSMKKYVLTLAAILTLQVGLGVSNIVAALPLAVAVAHNGVGALLLLTLVTINYQLWQPPAYIRCEY